MSYNLPDSKSKLALDVALTSKIEVYGMQYDTDWWEMFNRQMIINALELDDIYSFLSTTEREKLENRLTMLNN